MSKESEFLAKLKVTFNGEAEEHRNSIVAGLLELEKGSSGNERDSRIIENVFREVHSLKGAARAVDIRGIERLCQSVESIFSALKRNDLRPTRQLYDVLYRTFDIVGTLTGGIVPVPDEDIDVALQNLEAQSIVRLTADNAPAPPSHAQAPKSVPTRKLPVSMPDSVRITAARLNAIFLRAEEMLSVKDTMARHLAEFHDLMELQADWLRSWRGIHLAINKRNDMNESFNKFEAQSALIKKRLGKANDTASRDCVRTGERVDTLLSEVKTALLQPFSSLLEPFALMVRDLALEEGKEVAWVVRGDDTRIDRRVLEKIKDPLVHMVRNGISHGIELAAEREALGKPRAGTIALEIRRVDNEKVELVLRDDGAGIDVAKVKASAIAKGLIKESSAEQMKDEEVLDLVFLPELSTSPTVTVVSGRGLGLAIALENIEMVGGRITVETKVSKGTTFRVQLPLSLATFRAVLVKCRTRFFAVPTMNVDRVFRTSESAVISIDNRDSLAIADKLVALVDLGEILGMDAVSREGPSPASGSPSTGILAMVLLVAGTQVAYRIDGIEGEQELLAKDLGKQLLRVRNISGAAIMAGGAVIPILNPADLLKTVVQSGHVERGSARVKQTDAGILSVLVADDSVTSRSLMKGMLESAGYKVKTAVDGADAFACLQEEHFDLLISDVEMPRMDGFILCEKVRGSAKTSELPIILVTSMDAPEDRERGMEAGADALVSKSTFDKSGLLGVIQRLV